MIGQAGSPDSVTRGAFFIYASRAVTLATGFILQVSLARMLGVEDYGMYGLAITMVTWMEIVLWGMNQSITRETAAAPGEARRLATAYLRPMALTACGMLLAGLGMIVLLPRVFDRPGSAVYFLIAFADFPLMSMFCLYQGLLNGLGFLKDMAVALTVYYLSRMVLSLVLVAAGLSLEGALLGNLLCTVLALPVAVCLFRAHAPRGITETGERLRGLAVSAVPFVILPLAFNVSLCLNFWMAGIWASREELGVYNAAYSASRILFFFLSGLSVAIFPAVVSSLRRGSRDYRSLVSRGLRFITMASVPLALYGVITADVLMRIFGGDYLTGGPVLRLLLPGFALATYLFILNNFHLARGRYGFIIGCNLAVLAVEAAGCWLLIPRLGVGSGGLAMGLAMAVGIIVELAGAEKKDRVAVELSTLGRIFMAAAFSSIPLYFAHSLPAVVAAGALSATVYVLLLMLSGEVYREEIKQVAGRIVAKR